MFLANQKVRDFNAVYLELIYTCALSASNLFLRGVIMKSKATFYHAGCPVCISAEESVSNAIDRNRYDVEVVHLGDAKGRIAEAETVGVKSVPALVLDGSAFHINFGAGIDELK